VSRPGLRLGAPRWSAALERTGMDGALPSGGPDRLGQSTVHSAMIGERPLRF